MAATATGLYYARNRFYSPALGRFVTRDVNATALPIITALTFNGTTVDSVIDGFAAVRHFTDGLNVFLFASANPITRSDALGLTYDDSWLDDEIDAYTGHRLYALGMINEGAKWASIGIEVALDIASSLLGLDVLQSVVILASGKGGFWEAMDIVMAAAPLAGPVRALNKMRKYRRATAAGAAAVKYGGRLIKHHMVPRAVLRELPDTVRRAGRVRSMKGMKNIWLIPEDLHKILHGGGRRLWRAWRRMEQAVV